MKPIDRVIYWRSPEIQGLEICRVCDSGHIFPDHAHDGIYAIGMMERGGCYSRGPQKSDSLVVPGEIALINPGQVHSGVPVKGKRVSYRMIYFDCELMGSIASEIFRRPHSTPEFRHMVMREVRLWRCLEVFCQSIQGTGCQLEKESAVVTAVASLLSLGSNVTRFKARRSCGDRPICHAMAFLSEELDRKMSLQEVARVAGLSHYHFLRIFKRETGLPPHLFRIMRRIDRAKQLLRKGTPLSQAALMVGFSDQSHFSNTFRKYIGATPGQYISDFN